MKSKILTFSAIIIFILHSCTDTDDIPVTYLDNKLIEGTWIYRLVNDQDADKGPYTLDSTVYTFKYNKAHYKYYTYNHTLNGLQLGGDYNLGTYSITSDSILSFSIGNDRDCYLRLSKNDKDSLYMMNPANSPRYWDGFKRLKNKLLYYPD